MNERLDEATRFSLPAAAVARALPIAGPRFQRPDDKLIRALHRVSSATASALMHRMGVRQTFIAGARARQPGAQVVGPIVTLQLRPRREAGMPAIGRNAPNETTGE